MKKIKDKYKILEFFVKTNGSCVSYEYELDCKYCPLYNYVCDMNEASNLNKRL